MKITLSLSFEDETVTMDYLLVIGRSVLLPAACTVAIKISCQIIMYGPRVLVGTCTYKLVLVRTSWYLYK